MRQAVGITGSKGFIGSYLVKAISTTHEVAEFEGDLLNEHDVTQYFEANPKLEVIIHLAGLAQGSDYAEVMAGNVTTTHNLLSSASKSSVRKIILASSVAVYGQPENGASRESDVPKPNSVYGLSKLYAEELAMYFSRVSQLRPLILRFSPIYGPGNNKGVIYNLLSDIQGKGEVSITGDGSQKRNFLHVEDAVRSIINAIESNSVGVFNITNPAPISINDIIAVLKIKHSFKVNYQKAEGKGNDLLMNTDRAEEVLKFKAQITELQI